MNYLNRFKQLSDDAADALYGLIKDMINKNTTNIVNHQNRFLSIFIFINQIDLFK